ncbi:MAG: hypothetical protein JOZ27_03775 [Caulobacteraceae bacterium]|nr:hypothetical protein [Caulobacteraceae bacterium]
MKRNVGGTNGTSQNGPNVFLSDLAPAFESQETDYGFRYAALRSIPKPDGGHSRVVRVTAFIAPYTVINASGGIASIIVPLADDVTAFFHTYWGPERDDEGLGLDVESLRRYYLTRDLHRSPDRPSRANRWLQDRVSMRTKESFSGYAGLIADDVAVTASAGAIRDRSEERLAPCDLGIAMLYRRLKDFVSSGPDATAMNPSSMPPIPKEVGFQAELKPGEDWRTMTPRELTPA